MVKDLAVDVQGATAGDAERSGGERSEAPRSVGATTVEPSSRGSLEAVPDPEVAARPKRRQSSAEYRLRILKEADACKGRGEIGALLRREGLYREKARLERRLKRAETIIGIQKKRLRSWGSP